MSLIHYATSPAGDIAKKIRLYHLFIAQCPLREILLELRIEKYMFLKEVIKLVKQQQTPNAKQ